MKFTNALLLCVLSAVARGQSAVPVREIGKLERVSGMPLQSVMNVLSMPDGRVLLNDTRGRRLLMLDSMLSRATVIVDTSGTTDDAYARGVGEVLFRFRGDSALLVDISSLVGLVISPTGVVSRVLAFPPPPGRLGVQQLPIGGRGHGPGLDGRGRLVFKVGGGSGGLSITTLTLGMTIDADFMARLPAIIARQNRVDSLPIWRVDLATRHFDTVGVVRVPWFRNVLKTDENKGLTAIELTPDILPMVDGWTITSGGEVAIVRGIDYHVDWIDPDGRTRSSPKMVFDWQRLTDERKNQLADSAVKDMQAQFDRAASGMGRAGAGAPTFAPNVAVRPSVESMPTYVPAFDADGIRSDAEGNVWIKTSTIIKDRPVYDIVNRKGEIVDRVQLPEFRVISGFAPGVVFMAMQDSTGAVRLERARIR